MVKTRIVLLIGAVAFGCNAMVFAGTSTSSQVRQDGSGSSAAISQLVSPARFYVDVGAGITTTNQSAADTNVYPATTMSDQSGFGFGADVGYTLNDNVALELGAIKFADAKVNQGNNPAATMQYYALDAAVKGTIPLRGGYEVFGKLGVAYKVAKTTGLENGAVTNGSDQQTEASPLIAVGAAWNFNRSVALTVGYTLLPGGGIGDASAALLGLKISFG